MILSVSRRTDIPAFFSEWFFNRIKKGFVLVRNPMNIHQISRITIKPDVVDCIVFWTKNPERLIRNLKLIEKYCYYFQYTITGYGQKLEPNVPKIDKSIEYFRSLSKIIGSNKVIWRYDPIILTDTHNIKFHFKHFKYIADRLSGYTSKCVISFIDYYKNIIKNMAHINYNIINKAQMKELAYHFNNVGKKNNINILTCAEEIDLESIGIRHGKCIDDKLIQEISGFKFNIDKDKNQRQECGCVASIDIGAYNTCSHGCLYCYANYNINQVKRNIFLHDKNSDLIFGKVSKKDKISERDVKSCKIMQQVLFDNI